MIKVDTVSYTHLDVYKRQVQELSKLLRHVLYDNQQTFVPLEKELDFIRNYVCLLYTSLH